jgi:hypothetical protein
MVRWWVLLHCGCTSGWAHYNTVAAVNPSRLTCLSPHLVGWLHALQWFAYMVAIHYHLLAVPLGETNICSFYRQRVSVALQRVQAITILRRAVVATREVSSFRFGVIPDFSSITLHDLLCATGDGFRSRFRVFSHIRVPHCVFCTFKCVLHFQVCSFVWTLILSFSSLVPFLGVFPLFTYLGNRLT